IAVVEEAAGLDQKAPRIGAGPSGHPADRSRAGEPRQNLDGAREVLALDVFGDGTVVDPAIAVTDDFMALRHAGLGQCGVLLERAGDAEDARLDAEIAQ